MELKDRCAVVTGCSRGIGKAVMDVLASYGVHIFAVVRTQNESFLVHCEELKEKYGVSIWPVEIDFSNEESVKNGGKEILKQKKKIDILVNNAGTSNPLNMLQMTTMAAIRDTFEVNFFSQILFTQLIAKNMIRNKSGSIIFVSSSAAYDGGANIEYTAGKAALIGAVRRLALEFGPFSIRVNAVAPGLTDTDMGNSMSLEDEAIAVSRNIMGRKAKPEEIANVITFLASDLAGFMTGQTVRVDGGLLK